MTNAIASDQRLPVTETLEERVSALTATAEEIRAEVRKIRSEMDQVLEEVRSLPHGNEWARHG